MKITKSHAQVKTKSINSAKFQINQSNTVG